MEDESGRVERIGLAVTEWEKARVIYVADAKGLPYSILFRTMSLANILAEADRLDSVYAKRVSP